MSDNQMKILIIVLIIAIAGIGIGLYFNVTIKNNEYAQLQEEIAKKKEEETEKNKQEQINNKQPINIKINDSKLYKIIEMVNNNNIYIEVEVDGIITKKAVKGNKIYSSTNHITNIIMDGKNYVIDNNEKTVIINNSNDEKFSISFIDTDINEYENVEIKQGKEEYNGKIYDYETIDTVKYYYSENNLQYVVNNNLTTKINKISNANDTIFAIPQDYTIIDNTIVVE
ncbi:MAG: hypothetical protein E7311_05410 [Clostridiales bacterium]|nr:hypothetical protein [Clostridiales bacterium]